MTDIKTMSFEAAMAELEKVVRDLESGNVDQNGSPSSSRVGRPLQAAPRLILAAAA